MKVQNVVADDESIVLQPTGKSVSIVTTEDFASKIIDAELFNQALVESIANSGLFKINNNEHEYKITAKMIHWHQPPAGLTFHSDLRVMYTIEHGNEVIFLKELEANSVAKVSDAFSGMKRSKIGIERVMQNNIEMFMREIADVEFE
jgi:hypothetical protein